MNHKHDYLPQWKAREGVGTPPHQIVSFRTEESTAPIKPADEGEPIIQLKLLGT